MAFVNSSMRSVGSILRRGSSFRPQSAVALVGNNLIWNRVFSSDPGKDVEKTFIRAVAQVPGLRSEPGNEVKLKLYALYKQSTVGPCTGEKPGMFDVVAKYKWEAWSKLGSQRKEDAMKEYVDLVQSLIKSIGLTEGESADNAANSKSATSGSSGDDIVITNNQGILTMRLNRPSKKNALLYEMYHTMTNTLNEAAANDNIKMVVLTGTGDFFSSGNDLTVFQIKPGTDVAKLANDAALTLEHFVNAIIDFPKPLVGVINGPAFGIMVTVLALFDTVICSDKATFTTPFMTTSQTPEGCSTYTFPRIMGSAKANAMLLFNQPMNAQEAYLAGFVSKVIPHDQLDAYLDSWLYGPKGMLSFGSTITWKKGKPLIRTEEERRILREVNRIECKTLAEAWLSPDFTNAMMKFFTRRK